MYCPDYEESEKYVYYYANMGTGTEGEFVVFKYFGYNTGSSNVGGQGHNTIKLPYKLDAKPDFNVYIEDDEFRPFFWEIFGKELQVLTLLRLQIMLNILTQIQFFCQ